MKNRFLLWAAKGVGIFIGHAIKEQIIPIVRDELTPILKEAAKEALAAEIKSQIKNVS